MAKIKSKSYGLVVAVFKENIEWIRTLPHHINVYIYCKDSSRPLDDLSKESGVHMSDIVHLDNVGRESHTYLHHIINNYDCLEDIVGFVQGLPYEHCKDEKELLRWMYEASVQKYSNNFVRNDIHGTAYDWTLKEYRGSAVSEGKGECDSFGKWFEKYIKDEFPKVVLWAGGGQFATTKECILKRSKESYMNIMTPLMILNPVEGHYMERSWFYVFNMACESGTLVNIQDIHPDETSTLTNAFINSGYDVTSFKHYEGELNDPAADVLILAANPLANKYVNVKPFMLTVVGDIEISILKPFMKNKNFRGFVSTSSEHYNTLKEMNIPVVLLTRRYPYNQEMVQSLSIAQIYTNISSIITNYSEYSPLYMHDGAHSKQHFDRIQKTINNPEKPTQFHVQYYGDPGNKTDNDVEVIANSRYVLHLKYWGHVCNVVVKALALGVPVIMDKTTFTIGKYAAYVRHGENGLVFETTEDIISYLSDVAIEGETYEKIKATCVEEAAKYHYPYPANSVQLIQG